MVDKQFAMTLHDIVVFGGEGSISSTFDFLRTYFFFWPIATENMLVYKLYRRYDFVVKSCRKMEVLIGEYESRNSFQ